MSIPQSTIYICNNVRLNSRYDHTIYFADQTAQQNYFAGKVVRTFSAYSFIRKTWDLQIGAKMEEADGWSYLYFTNSANGKTYYYFIDNIEYVNDNTVRLKLQIDVLQTYYFEYDLLPCFVERQHTLTDEIGEHTVDESLEVGELTNAREPYAFDIGEMAVLVLATINPNYADTATPIQALSGKYDNVFSGLKVWAVNADNAEQIANWGSQLERLSEAGFIDGVVNMWMYPQRLVKLGGENTWGDDDLCKTVNGSAYWDVTLDNWGNPFDGYTPKNNKLFTYPYNFLYASNNAGGSAVYRYERSEYNSQPNWISFRVHGSISPDAATFLYPTDYNGAEHNYEEGLTLGSFPTCAWDSDTYKMWLAQNQNQQAHANQSALITAGAGAAAAVGSAVTGNIAGAVGGLGVAYSGLKQIQALNAQKADMSIQPPQARGQFSSNINMAMGRQTFTFYFKCLSKENARIVDDFFTMYGYKLNRVQQPRTNARKSFTYVKTIGCHVNSYLCNEDALKIEAIFDKGITFWKNGDRIGQYTDDNSPL